MKKLFIIPALFAFFSVSGQPDWKQSLRYSIYVKFDVPDKSLIASMKLDYVNHSSDTLSFIWFHVWPNAYRNDRTAYSDQLLENGDTRFYFSGKEQKGYLNRLSFRVNGIIASTEDHPEYIEIVKLKLDKPLPPGDSISIQSDFHLRLPYNFNGFGYTPHHFELRNWYPEPAVYDKHGWHPMPMLIQGGAYHESADFSVNIEVPESYQIAAGALEEETTSNGGSIKRRFRLNQANSFAFILDNQFSIRNDSLINSHGKKIFLRYFSKSTSSKIISENIALTKTGIQWMDEKVGEYPHTSISIVECPSMPDQDFSGLICIGTSSDNAIRQSRLNKTITAQWFQTVLMTDQRNQPWLSKGFIDYYSSLLGLYLNQKPTGKNNLWLRVAEKEKITQPVTASAPFFTSQNDTLMPGNKAALWISLLKSNIGDSGFDQKIQAYFTNWKFKHPDTTDFRHSLADSNRSVIDPVFRQLYRNNNFFDTSQQRKIRPTFFFSAKNSEKYNYIGFAPVPGYNHYDGFMLGALIHNINVPPNKFEFILAPLYAFGSQHIVGLGSLGYAWYPEHHFSKISVGIHAGHFDSNKATDSTGKDLYENFTKVVPYIRLDLKPSNPRSQVRRWIEFKSYLITEQDYEDFGYSPKDSLIHPNSVSKTFRYVNQIGFGLQNTRSLYPYDFRLEFQQSELFYRINLHGNYFMNYPDGGGLQIRFFGAKFGVWNQENSLQVNRYEPKLLGVNGEEDYLYENYFIGRTASYAYQDISVPNGGILAQQIMNRDGGLKLRIDETDYVQGKSANWVSSLGFSTSLPAHLFPFPLPVRLFFDVGTYAEAWENNPLTSRFLFTGGIQLSLFKNVLNIYAPLFYSSDFDDAMKGYDFGRKITFSIDFQNLNRKKIIQKLAGS